MSFAEKSLDFIQTPQFQGSIQAIGGLTEAGIGYGITAGSFGIASPIGSAFILHGIDQCATGLNTVFSGHEITSLTSTLLQTSGFSSSTASLIDCGVSMALGAPLALSVLSKAPKMFPILKNLGSLSRTTPSYTPLRPASSSVSSQLLKNKLIAKEISGGHAFEKHVLLQNEFPGYSRQQFEKHIRNILNNPTEMKLLARNRFAYWDKKSSTVVVRDPKHPDGGTAFKPKKGYKYYDRELW